MDISQYGFNGNQDFNKKHNDNLLCGFNCSQFIHQLINFWIISTSGSCEYCYICAEDFMWRNGFLWVYSRKIIVTPSLLPRN